MVGVWVEDQVVWEGGVSVSSGEEFGMVLWSVVRGIWRWRGVVSVSGGSGVWVGSGLMQGGEVGEWMLGDWV